MPPSADTVLTLPSGVALKDIAGKGRQYVVESGDEVFVRFADGVSGELLTVATDRSDPIAQSLVGKRLNDDVDLQRDGLTQNVTIEKITKTAGQFHVPFLGEGVKTARVWEWSKHYGQAVISGELLVTLKTGRGDELPWAHADRRGLIEVHAPISGVLNSVSRQVGEVVKPADPLGRIDYEPAPFRVRYSIVKPNGLPACMRVDYSIGFEVRASEWVCPDATGAIGDKGRAWWRERVGSVPETPEEALEFAKELAVPFEIDIEDAVRDRPPNITGFWHTADNEAKKVYLSGGNTVVLPAADKQQLRHCQAARYLGPTVSCHMDAPPAWWPMIDMNQVALTDPYDRYSVSPEAQVLLREALEACRNFFVQHPNKRIRFGQAIRNICMAYALSEPPLIEELAVFFNSFWPSDDIVLKRHRQELYAALHEIILPEWLNRIVDPVALLIASTPAHLREQRAKSLGLGVTGRINSGLNWVAQGYFFGEAWVPCIDLEGFFRSSMATNETVMKWADGGALPLLSFREALRDALREGINTVREKIGLPRIGEGWLTETDLYNRVKALLPSETVIHQGQPRWLGRQRFDIWIPDRKMAIEYHGEQHFVAVSVFGGEAGLEKTRGLDAKKRRLCLENNVELVEIAFNDDLSDGWLMSRLSIQKNFG